ncbi:Ltp family lipoprotein [Brachybacterium sp. FME24]|uniref:Ltp family lipoprotein n=1 Tax=Brachybacterium sp. FME24 TaxID=2742605 RepID=UPI00271453B5|nr:Ltp family lipoprotein [Brachybacterium sp. FME24]
MNSNAPSPQDSGSPNLPPAPNFGGPPHGDPQGDASAGSPMVPARNGKKKGLIAAGCGCVVLFLILVGGCSVFAFSGSDDPKAAETTAAEPAELDGEAEEVVDAEPAEGEELVEDEAPAEEESPADEAPAEEAPAEDAPAESEVPAEHTSALNSAQSYSDLMHMSKQGLFDQLTSEYADQFSDEAAQYAVDNVDTDWNENALASAESYSETMHMSKAGIYGQLTSEHGEQFLSEEAQYAIDTIEVDWNENALQSARSYRDTMDMSPEAIRDQLTSEYGDQFTQEQADYAIENLDG